MRHVILLILVAAILARGAPYAVVWFALDEAAGIIHAYNASSQSAHTVNTARSDESIVLVAPRCRACFANDAVYWAGQSTGDQFGNIQIYSTSGGTLTTSSTFNDAVTVLAVDEPTGIAVFGGRFNGLTSALCTRWASYYPGRTPDPIYCIPPNAQAYTPVAVALAPWGGIGGGYNDYLWNTTTTSNYQIGTTQTLETTGPMSAAKYHPYFDTIMIASNTNWLWGGQSFGNLAMWNGSAIVRFTQNPVSYMSILAIECNPNTGDVYVGGDFSGALNFYSYNGYDVATPESGATITGKIFAMSLDPVLSRLYIGGDFTSLPACSTCNRVGYIDLIANLYKPLPGLSAPGANVVALAVQMVDMQDVITLPNLPSQIQRGTGGGVYVDLVLSFAPLTAVTFTVTTSAKVQAVTPASFTTSQRVTPAAFFIAGTSNGLATLTISGSTSQYAPAQFSFTIIDPSGTVENIPPKVWLTGTIMATVALAESSPTQPTVLTVTVSPPGSLTLNPSTVTVPPGALTAPLAITCNALGPATLMFNDTTGRIVPFTRSLYVYPQDSFTVVAGSDLPNAALYPGASLNLTLLLSAPAQRDATIQASSCDPILSPCPSTFTIPAGATAVNASLIGAAVGMTKVVLMDVSDGQYATGGLTVTVTGTDTITIDPPAGLGVESDAFTITLTASKPALATASLALTVAPDSAGQASVSSPGGGMGGIQLFATSTTAAAKLLVTKGGVVRFALVATFPETGRVNYQYGTQTVTLTVPEGANVGLIIGATIGALAVVLVSIGVACLLYRRRAVGSPRKAPAKSARNLPNDGSTVLIEGGDDAVAQRVERLLADKTTAFIGGGGSADVFKARLEDGTFVALKRLKSTTPHALEEFHREVNILSRLISNGHPNVIQLRFVAASSNVMCLELADKGSLKDVLAKGYKLTEGNRRDMLHQVASGMNFLHDHNIVHLDLKTDNVLMADGDVLKITDFGSARDSFDQGSLDGLAVVTVFNGTPQFCAPERFMMGDRIDLKRSDVYSYGVVAWSLYTKEIPFKGEKTDSVVDMLQSFKGDSLKDKFPLPPNVAHDLAAVIKSCFSTAPKERRTFAEILSFLNGGERKRSTITTMPGAHEAGRQGYGDSNNSGRQGDGDDLTNLNSFDSGRFNSGQFGSGRANGPPSLANSPAARSPSQASLLGSQWR